EVGVVADESTGRAEVDDPARGGRLLPQVVDVRHHVMAQLALQLGRPGEVEVIEVLAKLRDRLVRDLQAELTLGFRQRQPQPTPGSELEARREDVRHLPRRVPLRERVAVSVRALTHASSSCRSPDRVPAYDPSG